eukprot:CAMPEP_0181288560 /NCGR_PEP_ID=MMETSP1101-20121128/399_1 /TAXON_ID=46948 /ORGANISM="Rhodomonas abbreviata, Strain Caron Lab Isolate" /LENGTH=2254 /DNA_ID=CAMNT_0023392693 /DNA_START=96 /DNA_END=6861 /DNA_ORIENTATION=+
MWHQRNSGAESSNYGSVRSRPAADDESWDRKSGRRRRLLQAATAVLAIASCIYVVGGFWATQMGGEVELIDESEVGAVNAERTPAKDTYCSVFSDPAECDQQRGEGQYRYWNAEQVKTELWKTMKALAELELREHAHHSVHKEKAEEQAQLFELFRKTMAREVTDIHTLQEEMHKQHTAAFQRLAAELVQTAADLKNYTDNGLGDVNERVTALSQKQEDDSQRILVTLAERVADLHAQIRSLHAESMSRINATEAYAQGVEAAMHEGDERLMNSIQGLDTDLGALDTREASHFENATAAMAAAVAMQQRDRAQLEGKIEGDVSALRENASTALVQEKAEIRAHLSAGLGDVSAGIEALRQNISARARALAEELEGMQRGQHANNEEQAQQIAALRSDFEASKAEAFRRMDAADARLSAAFTALTAASDKAMLLFQLQSNVSTLAAKREALEGWALSSVASLNASVAAIAHNLSAARAHWESQRAEDLRTLTEKITNDVGAMNSTLHEKLQRDWSGLDARIRGGLKTASDYIGAVNASAEAKHHAVVERVVKLETEVNGVDARQDAMLQGMARDAALERALVEARAAALEGNMTAAKARLAALTSEVARVQEEDRADIHGKVETGVEELKTKLTGDVTESQQTLGDAIHTGLGDVQSRLSFLQGSSDSEYSALARQVSELSNQQRLQDRAERNAIDSLNTTQLEDAGRVKADMASVMSNLRSAEARLSAALSRVASERLADQQTLSSKIDTDVSAAQSQLHLQVQQAESALNAALAAAITRLDNALSALRSRTGEELELLQHNVSEVSAAQAAEDERQRAWLGRLRDAATEEANSTATRIALLQQQLEEADARQTLAAEALERLQMSTANGINQTLHSAIDALRSRVLGDLAANKNIISASMDGGFASLRLRISTLGDKANATALAIQEAIAAMGHQCHAKHNNHTAEMSSIEAQAQRAQSTFNARLDEIERKLLEGKADLERRVAEANAAQAAGKAAMEAYITQELERVGNNASMHLARTEGGLRADLASEIGKLGRALQKQAQEAAAEAAGIKGGLQQQEVAAGDQHAAVMAAVERLARAITDSKSNSDQALAALSAGLQATKERLNSTRGELSAEQAEASSDIKARIQEGLASLQANFSGAMAEQQRAARDKLQARADAVEARVATLRSEMHQGVDALNRSVAGLASREQAASARHSAEIARMLQSQERDVAGLQAAVSALRGALGTAESSLGARSGQMLVTQREGLEELHEKLARCVEQLTAATSDVSDKAAQKLLEVQGKLAAAKAEVEQTQEELRREHASDTEEVKGKIEEGLREVEGKVREAIVSSLASVRADLGGQMAALRSQVAQVKGQAESTEQSLRGKMADLTSVEASHNADQAQEIGELVSKQQQLSAQSASRYRDIGANITTIESIIRNDYADLERERREDQTSLIARIGSSVSETSDALLAELARLKTQLSGVVSEAMEGASDRVTQERTSVEEALARMAEQVRGVAEREANSGEEARVRDLELKMNMLQRDVAANNSGLNVAMSQMVQQLRTEQAASLQQQQADVATYTRASAEYAAALRANFSDQLKVERDTLLEQVHALVDGLDAEVTAGTQGPTVTLGELREALAALKRELGAEYNARWAEIRAINSTSLTWVNSMLSQLTALRSRLESARQAQLRGNSDSRRQINDLQYQLQQLTQAASSVASVEDQLAALRERLSSVGSEAAEQYAGAARAAGGVGERVETLQEELNVAVERMEDAVAAEGHARERGHANTSAAVESLRARVEWIEEELRRLRLWANQSYAAAAQEAAPPEEFPPPQRRAPVYTPPPVPEGETPPPYPLLFWDFRTEARGMDEEQAERGAGVRLGATTVGTLTGTIVLPAAGRWAVYLVLHAADGGDAEDEVKVTVNGMDLGTYHNNMGAGFPCGTRSCLNTKGLYAVTTDINGGTVEYALTWTSANADSERHMYLGTGEAAFLGESAAPPENRANSAMLRMTAVDAVDAKTVKTGMSVSDGFETRGYLIPTDPRLVVLQGTEAIVETTMRNGMVSSLRLPEQQAYTCVVTLPGFFHYMDPACSAVRGDSNFALMSPVLPPGMSRFVLQWGSRPRDLDIYLLAPHQDPTQPDCEVNYRSKTCHSGTVHLDKDDVNGHGPETITVQHFNSGQYILRIDEYRGNPNAASWPISHALVSYYSPHLGSVQYSVETDGYLDGDVWYVMAVDGTTRNPVACTREIARPATARVIDERAAPGPKRWFMWLLG